MSSLESYSLEDVDILLMGRNNTGWSPSIIPVVVSNCVGAVLCRNSSSLGVQSSKHSVDLGRGK